MSGFGRSTETTELVTRSRPESSKYIDSPNCGRPGIAFIAPLSKNLIGRHRAGSSAKCCSSQSPLWRSRTPTHVSWRTWYSVLRVTKTLWILRSGPRMTWRGSSRSHRRLGWRLAWRAQCRRVRCRPKFPARTSKAVALLRFACTRQLHTALADAVGRDSGSSSTTRRTWAWRPELREQPGRGVLGAVDLRRVPHGDRSGRAARSDSRAPRALLGDEARAAAETALLVKWLDAGRQPLAADPSRGRRPEARRGRDRQAGVLVHRRSRAGRRPVPRLSSTTTAAGMREALDRAATSRRCLRSSPVERGDFVLLEPGTPHAIGRNVR